MGSSDCPWGISGWGRGIDKTWGLKGGDLIKWLLVLEGCHDRVMRTVDTKQDGFQVVCISAKRPLGF